MSVRALIADDEPLLRGGLARMLAQAWPDLQIIAEARNGREAVAAFEQLRPEVCFLDVQMPGINGIEAARQIGQRAHLVFVTAFSEYAVQAFDRGALDYLVKPVELARLQDTVARLRDRLQHSTPILDRTALLDELEARLRPGYSRPYLRWLNASLGGTVQVIDCQRIDYLRSDEKYTRVVWRRADGGIEQSLVRMALKELLAQLDPDVFVQVHRSAAVNRHAIDRIERHDNETATVHLRASDETLPMSRSFIGQFRQM
ncbi:LytR/AlgR family response regulator transcription factor [Pseudomarimonas arenosa]|uniref:Response regulator transcription factor n=1 Tax=Pseudomarimonas arenosa TaxID=2774145 RepID=A0AAW3ZMK8_9GAMM|nr:LytTR family DNA-binding domain-containing protein [Pseudomarimonas arenosa]MBD8526422.1 response regulator transcription factor [Pseudomarimonas arenosa]